MHEGVESNPATQSTKWTWEQARDLCAGSQDSGNTVQCFKDNVGALGLKKAITKCNTDKIGSATAPVVPSAPEATPAPKGSEACKQTKRQADTTNNNCMNDPDKSCDCLQQYEDDTADCKEDPAVGAAIQAFSSSARGGWAATCGKEEKGCKLIYEPANYEYNKCVRNKTENDVSYCPCVRDFLDKTWEKCEKDKDLGGQLKVFKSNNQKWGCLGGNDTAGVTDAESANPHVDTAPTENLSDEMADCNKIYVQKMGDYAKCTRGKVTQTNSNTEQCKCMAKIKKDISSDCNSNPSINALYTTLTLVCPEISVPDPVDTCSYPKSPCGDGYTFKVNYGSIQCGTDGNKCDQETCCDKLECAVGAYTFDYQDKQDECTGSEFWALQNSATAKCVNKNDDCETITKCLAREACQHADMSSACGNKLKVCTMDYGQTIVSSANPDNQCKRGENVETCPSGRRLL